MLSTYYFRVKMAAILENKMADTRYLWKCCDICIHWPWKYRYRHKNQVHISVNSRDMRHWKFLCQPFWKMAAIGKFRLGSSIMKYTVICHSNCVPNFIPVSQSARFSHQMRHKPLDYTVCSVMRNLFNLHVFLSLCYWYLNFICSLWIKGK